MLARLEKEALLFAAKLRKAVERPPEIGEKISRSREVVIGLCPFGILSACLCVL